MEAAVCFVPLVLKPFLIWMHDRIYINNVKSFIEGGNEKPQLCIFEFERIGCPCRHARKLARLAPEFRCQAGKRFLLRFGRVEAPNTRSKKRRRRLDLGWQLMPGFHHMSALGESLGEIKTDLI